MKKINLMIGSLLVLTACSSANTETPTTTVVPTQSAASETSALRVGSASITTIDTTEVNEGKSSAKFITSTVGLAVDNDNRIVYVDFDTAENSVTSENGVLTAPEKGTTKRGLGADYPMVKASSIGKNWDEQVDTFEEMLVGKTIDEVLALELDESGKAVDTDVLSGATIALSDFITLIDNASGDLKEVENVSTLGMAMETKFDLEEPSDKRGGATAKTTVAFYGVDSNNTVAFTFFDVAENKAVVDSEGNWTKPETTTTKRSLGNDYNMVKASSIGKEWFEQVDAFQESTVGQTFDQVLSMELDNGKSTNVDVLSSCTIGLNDFLSSLNAASQYAKGIQ